MENKYIEIKNKLDEGLTFKISKFKEQIKKTKPHKHDEYYELIFLSEGEGFHSIESENYLVSTPDFFYLKPGQMHFWQFTAIPKGFVLLFKDSEFDPINESILIELNKKLSDTTRISFDADNYPDHILNEMYFEYNRQNAYSREIIHGLLKALVGKLLQLAGEISNKTELPHSLFDKFHHLLTKECPRLHKVNEFANLLNVTPQNLNHICRKQSGKSASDIINSQLLIEAKRYILHTDNTVNEIADTLFFSDVSNFVKFFKKHEQLTPIQFRKMYFQ